MIVKDSHIYKDGRGNYVFISQYGFKIEGLLFASPNYSIFSNRDFCMLLFRSNRCNGLGSVQDGYDRSRRRLQKA